MFNPSAGTSVYEQYYSALFAICQAENSIFSAFAQLIFSEKRNLGLHIYLKTQATAPCGAAAVKGYCYVLFLVLFANSLEGDAGTHNGNCCDDHNDDRSVVAGRGRACRAAGRTTGRTAC